MDIYSVVSSECLADDMLYELINYCNTASSSLLKAGVSLLTGRLEDGSKDLCLAPYAGVR